jgi:hypothetical protein
MFDPTAEQLHAIGLFATGDSMVIEAGAGTGKTATLLMLADEADARGQYIAFNKAIVTEAQAKFPSNVKASTAHSLAFQAVGKSYSQRLRAPRMKSTSIAKLLGIKGITVVDAFDEPLHLTEGYLAGLVMRGVTRFCQSGDPEVEGRHIEYVEGIDARDAEGNRTWAHNAELRERLLPALQKAWVDLSSTSGDLPFKHDHYLKLYQLSDPEIDAEFILFDEAQDANPVIAAIVAAQSHAQRVYVGDSQQQIYEFTGAVNALGAIDAAHRAQLTQSFRFGPAIANRANDVLAKIPSAELRLKGLASIASTLGTVDDPRAILTRTNATAVTAMIDAQSNGRRPHLVGGGGDVLAFARAASELQDGRRTYHPELACFRSWGEVVEYVDNDVQGDDLALLVRLIENFGADEIARTLSSMPSEDKADVTISTAHKSKGREWSTVRLADDFQKKPGKNGELPPPPTDSELRLLYVAITRARLGLDDTNVAALLAA